jgi:hypothetical protein
LILFQLNIQMYFIVKIFSWFNNQSVFYSKLKTFFENNKSENKFL